jgi:hypothetical protein
MRNRPFSMNSGTWLGVICGWLVFSIIYPGTNTEAACPPLLSVQGWFSYTVQNYVAVTLNLRS